MSKPKQKKTFKYRVTKPSEQTNPIMRIKRLDMSKKWEVIIKPYVKDRSIAQNKLAFKWYKERGEQNGNGAHYERLFCKFMYGCPRMIEQEAEAGEHVFTDFYNKLINTYDFEECVNAMEFVEVTSMFKVKTFVNYLNIVEGESVNNGLHLAHPDDSYWEAMGVKP